MIKTFYNNEYLERAGELIISYDNKGICLEVILDDLLKPFMNIYVSETLARKRNIKKFVEYKNDNGYYLCNFNNENIQVDIDKYNYPKFIRIAPNIIDNILLEIKKQEPLSYDVEIKINKEVLERAIEVNWETIGFKDETLASCSYRNKRFVISAYGEVNVYKDDKLLNNKEINELLDNKVDIWNDESIEVANNNWFSILEYDIYEDFVIDNVLEETFSDESKLSNYLLELLDFHL